MAIDPQWSGDYPYPTFYMKAGDRLPEFVVQLMYADGSFKDLTDHTATLVIKRAVGGRQVLSANMTLSDPELESGYATYEWAAPLEEGEYLMEVRIAVEGESSIRETFPRNGYMKLVVNASL